MFGRVIAFFFCVIVIFPMDASGTPPPTSTNSIARFGYIWGILHGQKPHLDFTQGSAATRFHYKIAVRWAPGLKDSTIRPILCSVFIVRDQNLIVVLVRPPGGIPFYYLYNDHRGVMATIGRGVPARVLIAEGVRLSISGILVRSRAAKLRLPVGNVIQVQNSDAKPLIFLRLLSYVGSRTNQSRFLAFSALPEPNVYLEWGRGSHGGRMLVFFHKKRYNLFPISQIENIRSSGDLTVTTCISHIGAGLGRGGHWPIAHNIKNLGKRLGLPVKETNAVEMMVDFRRSYESSRQPVFPAMAAIRDRFIRWACGHRPMTEKAVPKK